MRSVPLDTKQHKQEESEGKRCVSAALESGEGRRRCCAADFSDPRLLSEMTLALSLLIWLETKILLSF